MHRLGNIIEHCGTLGSHWEKGEKLLPDADSALLLSSAHVLRSPQLDASAGQMFVAPVHLLFFGWLAVGGCTKGRNTDRGWVIVGDNVLCAASVGIFLSVNQQL